MACRRCSTCGINYPTSYQSCEACGEKTDWMVGDEPDPDYDEKVRLRLAGPSVTEAGMRDYRHRELSRLGFGGAILDVLADASTDVHLARQLIESGCPLETAARILI